jgi:hypothetical protein
VSGIIQLNSRLVLNKPYVTVAGQTAPGKGICIKSAPFGITGNDCIVRHMRVRVGSGITYDGMGLTGANYSIMDHCSISWTIDESFSSRGAKNITLQRTLISEALNAAGHANYPAGTEHGYAATIGGDTGSFHHNLLAHCYGRNWSLGGGLDGSGFYTGELDIRNNVVYNWGSRTTDGGAKEVNFVNNYYKPGAGTRHFFAFTLQHEGVGKGTQRCYFAGNVMPGRFNESNQETGRRSVNSNGDTSSYQTFVNAPFFESYVNTQSAKDAYKRVLSDVGATQPVFDDHDTRMVRETLDSTWSVTGSITGKPGFPDDEQDAGGWENYPEEARPANWDTDLDGLPDWFEQLKNSNINSAAGDFSDANKDQDKDGYTRLDEYLEFMGSEHYFARPFQLMAIDLSTFTRGYTNRPVFSVRNMNNGLAVQLPWDNGTLYFLTLFKGFASFTFTVRDAEGSSMTRTINIAVSDHPTLPVDDFNFTTSRQNPTTVSLTWENAKEIPFASYEIQRGYSIDGPFTSVTTVKGKLQSINTRSVKSVTYDLQDNNNYTGYTWYKLLLKDADGKVILTKLGVVEGSEADPSVKIWPVPSKGEFNLMLMDETVPVTVQIRRVDGAAVGKDELVYPRVSRTFTINVPGTYIITGVNKESGKQVFSSKVVIQ